MLVLLLCKNVQLENYLQCSRYEYMVVPTMDVLEDRWDALDRKPPELVFFDGGSDVTPSYYGEVNNGLSSCNPLRDSFESEVFRRFRYKPTRFAGICRGSQFLNVMFGGTLHQNLPQTHPYYHNAQNIQLQFLPEMIKVNSTHHQGVKELATGLIPILIEPRTGIIEGYCDAKDKKVRAVQSHPEYRDGQYPYSQHILDWLFEEM